MENNVVSENTQEKKSIEVTITAMPKLKTNFRDLYEEAEGLSDGSIGRSLTLIATSTTDNPMVYLDKDGKRVGLIQDPTEIQNVVPIIKDGNYSAHLSGTAEGGRIRVKVEESDKPKNEEDLKQTASDTESRIIEEGILTKEKLDERIAYLKEIGIEKKDKDYSLVLSTIKHGTSEKPETIYKVIGKKKDNPMRELLTSIALGENVILEGPKSVGKNVMWESAAWVLNCQIVLLQCNGRMTKAEMFGFEATDNSAKNALSESGLNSFFGLLKNGIFEKEGTDFALNLAKSMSPTLAMENGSILEALERANNNQGVILVLDEMNLSEPNTLSGAINDIADGHTPSIFVAGKGLIPVNRENFILGATQNGTGGDFVGTRKQNDATMSRFSCIKMRTPNSIINLLRQMNIEGLEDKIYDIMDDVYKNYKDGVSAGTYPMSCLNVRGFKAALKRIALGRPIKASISICVNNTVPNQEDAELLDNALDDIIPKGM